MIKQNTTDCIPFINTDMVKFIIAWQRADTNPSDKEPLPEINADWSPKKIAKVLNTSIGQARSLVEQAIAVGIIVDGGKISDIAQKIANSLIAKMANDLKN